MNKLGVFIIFLLLLIFGIFYPIPFRSSSITGNYGDIYKHYYPLKHLVAEHIIAGRMPFWNPYIFAGQPLLANPQSAVFYPLSALFYVFPLATAFNLFFMLHFFLAGIFIFLFLKNNGFCNTAAVIGSLSFCFSGFLLGKVPAGHPAAFSGYIWLPLIMLLSDALSRSYVAPSPLMRDGRGEEVIAKPDLFFKAAGINIAVLSLALAFQFLSGHTFPLFITVMYLLIFLMFNCRKVIKPYCVSFACALLLSCAQFIPTFALARASETGNWPGIAQNYSLPFKNLINFIVPGFYGNIFKHTFVFPLNPSYFFEKYSFYMGLTPLFLALIGLFLLIKRKKLFYPALFFAGLFFAAGFNNPVYACFYHYFPGFNYLRVPARFIYLTIISASLLSAYAWNQFSAKLHTAVKLLAIAIVLIDIFQWGKQYIYPEDLSNYEKKNALSVAFTPEQRILTEPDAVNPGKSMLYHHFNLNGYEAIFLKDFTRYLGLQESNALNSTGICRTDLLSPLAAGFSVKYIVSTGEEKNARLVSGPQNGVKIYEIDNPLPRAYFPRKLKFIDSEDLRAQLDYLKNTKLPPFQEALVSDGIKPPDNYLAEGKVLSYGSASDKVFVEAAVTSPSVMVISDIFYNGWRAAAGKHKLNVFRANKVFQAVCLPKGSYTGADRIVFYFLPGSFILGLIITLSSTVALYVFLLLRFKKATDEMREAAVELHGI